MCASMESASRTRHSTNRRAIASHRGISPRTANGRSPNSHHRVPMTSTVPAAGSSGPWSQNHDPLPLRQCLQIKKNDKKCQYPVNTGCIVLTKSHYFITMANLTIKIRQPSFLGRGISYTWKDGLCNETRSCWLSHYMCAFVQIDQIASYSVIPLVLLCSFLSKVVLVSPAPCVSVPHVCSLRNCLTSSVITFRFFFGIGMVTGKVWSISVVCIKWFGNLTWW